MKWILAVVAVAGIFVFGIAGCSDGGGDNTSGGGEAAGSHGH